MASETHTAPEKHALEPAERLAEILFGLIMVLTFTGSISVATADRAEVKAVLIGAIGCNVAWGLIDAIMFLMASLHAQGADIQTLRSVREAPTEQHAHAVIRRALPRVVSDELHPEFLERIRRRIAAMPEATSRPRLTAHDLRGALAVALVVIGSTFPVIVPFIFMDDLPTAMRVSNAIAVGMLALIGYAYGRASGLSAWLTSATMVILGVVLVAITIALGG